MRFDIISIFPESFASYFGVSMLRRAQEDGLIEIHTHNLRDFAHDRHKTVDDTPYGGGAGMVLKIEPLAEALEQVSGIPARPAGGRHQASGEKKEQEKRTRIILFSAKGRVFTQADARRLALYD
ncbi:MAG: tRNA (guanosine(37)-N1)-methyltransferase TrmD, partial [Candidatus Moraniibacteriota bacterium]